VLPQRIAIIGNGGGGKTTLARSLAQRYGLPLHHVDSIQYVRGMRTRDVGETRAILDQLAAGERWILDGFGPLDVLERRFARATAIVFVDFPLWRHYWWASKRQWRALRHQRPELPEGCSEAGLRATWRLFRILWRVHRVLRPSFLEQFASPALRGRVLRVRTLGEWRRVHEAGLDALG
jgi:adenylate kinase family enzyme